MSLVQTADRTMPAITVAALRRVGQRRRMLLSVRGLAIVLAVVATASVAVAFADRVTLLSEAVRGWLAAGFFLVMASAGGLAALPLWRRWGDAASARLVEDAVPAFRHRLLAAVELADEGARGSLAFREALQQSVAGDLQGFTAAAVLPWQKIRRPLWLAMAAVAISGGLFAIPSLSLPQHLLRVLFPAANIARPSLADLRFLSPASEQSVVPLDERLAVELEVALPDGVSSGLPETVRLEIEVGGDAERSQTVSLTREAADSPDEQRRTQPARYTGQWLIDAPEVRYRAVSAVGETPWQRLHAVPRPQVEGVEIAVTPPDYAGVPPAITAGQAADVAAVIGSQVRWTIQPSRDLQSATLVWLDPSADAEEPERVALGEGSDGRWSLELPVASTRRLQFELVGEEGMPSQFPATSRLTALEDEPPRLIWRQPEVHEATVPAVSRHALAVEVADEYPLTSVEQWIRINRGEWMTAPIAFDEGVISQTVAWTWDLAGLGLVPTDLVESKLVAVDRRGLQGSSPMLEWVVSESLLKLSAAAEKPARREIATRLGELAADLETRLGDEALAPLTKQDAPPEEGQPIDAADLHAVAASLRDAADDLAVQAAQLREMIHAALADTDERLTADELTLTAAVLSRLEHEEVRQLSDAADELDQAARGDDLANALKRAAAIPAATRVRQTLQQVDRRFRSLAGQDVLDEAAERLDAAVRFQEELVSRPEMLGSEAHHREQQLLAVHLRALAVSLARDSRLLPGGAARQATGRGRWAEEMADRLEQAARQPAVEDDEQARGRAVEEASEMLRQLDAQRSVHGIYPGLSGEARQARRELRKMGGSSAEVIGRTAEEMAATAEAVASDTRAAEETLTQLKDRRTAMLAQADAQQAEAAADLGAAYRGLAGLVEPIATDEGEVRKRFDAGQRAVQTLEAAGRLQTVLGWVDQMLASERETNDRVAAHTATPRIWEATSQELDDAATAMRQAGLPTDVADRVRAARWSPAAEEIGRKVSPRQWDLSSTVSAAAELATLRGELQAEYEALRGPIADARAVLSELAPSIPDLAREAAERAARQHEQTEQLAAEAAAGESTDLKAVLPEATAGEDEIFDRLESALVDAAASQDLLDATERERARDADLARELVSASQERVDEATAEAREQADGEQAAALEELSEAYREAEETLSMIAEHFGRDPLTAAGDAGEQQESLQTAAARQAPEAAARLDEAYREAEQLSEVAETPPEDLLRRLEEELQTNLPMREALSDIAGGLAEQSQAALAFAAERERALRHDVESSDATIREEKRQFAAELRLITEQTARVAQRLGQEAQRQAEAAGLPERQQQLADTARSLEQAVETLRTVPDTAGIPELMAAASRLDQAIDTASPALQDASTALAASAPQPQPDQTDDQQRRALSDATVASGRWHQQDVRWADQDLRTRERRIQEADRLMQEADRQVERAAAQVDKSRQQLQAEPESGARQEQLARAEVQQREAEAFRGLAADIRQREEVRLEAARAHREQVGRQPEVLDAANPRAQLAQRLTDDAAEQANQLSEQLGTMLTSAGWQKRLQSSQGQLATSARQQETVTATVADAARSLERAAAHEMRLGGFATAGQLADAAQRVEATSRQEPVAASEMLAEAAESAEAMSTAGRATEAASAAAAESLSRAGEAIAQRADELARLLAPTADSEDGTNSREGASPGESGQSAGASPSGSQLLEPAEMARMLDDLDREMRQSQPGSPSSPGQSGEASAARRALRRSSNQLARGLQQQRGTAGRPQPQEQQAASMQDAQATPSMANQSGSGQLTEMAAGDATGEVRLLEADGRDVFIGGWNRLRERQAGEVVESVRETVSPRYRRQVEQYFRGLSERGQDAGGAP